MKNVKLNNGVEVPSIGLGTWQIDNDHIYQAVFDAIECGYRHFDSAQGYFNEENLGKAISECGIKREELFITTKVMDIHKSYEATKASIEESFAKLKTPYIDLLLIHCPAPWDEYDGNGVKYNKENLEVWRCMCEYYKAGKIKAIGVSNFSIEDLQNIIDNSDVIPAVNQIPVYLGKTNWELINYCLSHGIAVEAYSPIAHGKILNNETVQELAKKYNVTIPQLCLAYVTQLGFVALPKTLHKEYMKANIDWNFTIDDADMEYFKNLKLNVGW